MGREVADAVVELEPAAPVGTAEAAAGGRNDERQRLVGDRLSDLDRGGIDASLVLAVKLQGKVGLAGRRAARPRSAAKPAVSGR